MLPYFYPDFSVQIFVAHCKMVSWSYYICRKGYRLSLKGKIKFEMGSFCYRYNHTTFSNCKVVWPCGQCVGLPPPLPPGPLNQVIQFPVAVPEFGMDEGHLKTFNKNFDDARRCHPHRRQIGGTQMTLDWGGGTCWDFKIPGYALNSSTILGGWNSVLVG